MRFNLKILLIVFLTGVFVSVNAQNKSDGNRSPEQEAAKQTEKYQKELKLTDQQAKLLYEINLKYARERKQSNNRTEAVNRIRKKNEEISRVLNEKQNHDLQNKRSENQSVEIDGKRNFTRTHGIRESESTRTNYRNTQGNRPVRQPRTTPSTRQSTEQREGTRATDRPVRTNMGGTSRRSSTSSDTRERSSTTRGARPTNSSNRSSVRENNTRQQSSSSSRSRSERPSQPTRRESGGRR